MADRKLRKHIAVAAVFLLALLGVQILYLAKLSVWDGDMNEFSNTVRVHVSALRRKLKESLGKNIIRNEIGKGYIIDEG